VIGHQSYKGDALRNTENMAGVLGDLRESTLRNGCAFCSVQSKVSIVRDGVGGLCRMS
jgi:hypothetical protein